MSAWKEIARIVTAKIARELSVMPFLASGVAFGLLFPVVDVEKAASVALLVGGVVGGAELMNRKREVDFRKACEDFKAIQRRDAEAFLQLAERVGGTRSLDKLDMEDIAVEGLVFRKYMSWPPVPWPSIGGPLCPQCGKNLSFAPGRGLPWMKKVRYSCLCGFTKDLDDAPYVLYMRVRRHLNFPIP